MTEFTRRLIECAEREWGYFGKSTRDLDDQWQLGGHEADEPFRSHIGHYWAAVGHPRWNGASPYAWSAAFICWCVKIADPHAPFFPDATHSTYVDRIRRHDEMSELLVLRPPAITTLAPGDLIWNSRQDDPAHPNPGIPVTYEAAIDELKDENFFDSHVDIVVAVSAGRCESIGGNVWPRPPAPPGGSVVRSAWRLNGDGMLDDERKDWIGVIKNGL
jgi:hypothetical protein